MPPDILIHGPFGGANVGDDLIRDSIRAALSGLPGTVRYSTLARPELNEVPFLDIRRLVMGELTAAKNADFVIVGGGAQIAEPRLPNPVWGLLANVHSLSQATRIGGGRFLLWGVGVDMPLTRLGRGLFRRVLRTVDRAYFRDEASLAYAVQTLPTADLRLGADPAFATPMLENDLTKTILDETIGDIVPSDPYGLIFPVHDKLRPIDQSLEMVATAARSIARLGRIPIVAVTDRQPGYDLKILRSIQESLPWVGVVPADRMSVRSLVALVHGADIVVSARMHPLIVAATQGVPWVTVVRGPKMDSFASMFPGSQSVPLADVVNLPRAIEAALGDSSAEVTRKVALLRSTAEAMNRDIITRMVA